MAIIREGFIPSVPRRIWTFCASALAWFWFPGALRRKWIAEGACEERQAIIRTIEGVIVALEKRPGAGKVRHVRYVLAFIRIRHNRIENVRRDGEGSDELLGEIDPKEFERVAKEGGTLTFKKPGAS